MPTVNCSVIGTSTAPKVNEVKPINPTTLRVISAFLRSAGTLKPLPVERAKIVDEQIEKRLANITMSKALTPFWLQAIFVMTMNEN